MLKQGTFINKKFYSMLFFNLLCWGAYSANTMIDAILGGNQLGEVALSAVSIVAPINSFVSFLAYVFTPGCGILFGINIGAFKKEEAYRTAGTSVVSSLVIGLAGALLLLAIKTPFLNYYGCTGELLENASTYYNWYIAQVVVFPLSQAIYYLIVADGAAFYIMLGSVGSILANIILSYALCKTIGISGLGMATVLSEVVAALLFAIHFFTKANSVHFKLSLDAKILKRACVLSANSSLNFIFITLVDIIMNKIILVSCGQVYIAAYSVVNFVLAMFLIPGGVFDSCQGICTGYVGEKNNYGINNILKTAMKSVYIISGAMMVALFIAAPYIPRLYGMTTPEVIAVSIRAARILCVSTIPFGVTFFAYKIYASMNKPLLSIIMAFLYNFFCPLILSIPLAFAIGFDGVSIGMSLSSFLVIILFVCFLRAKYGKDGFPWYLEETGEEAFGYDLCVTKGTIPEIRDKVKAELDHHGYEIENLELLIEELYTRIYEKNPGKTVCSECTLLFGKNHVRIIVRDNGTIFNFVDENNSVESMNAHVLNSLLERTEDKQYLITTSFNRNGFVFEKQSKRSGMHIMGGEPR